MTAILNKAFAALATMSDEEIRALGLVWRFPCQEGEDHHFPTRAEVKSALRFGHIDAVRFPKTTRGLLSVLREPEGAFDTKEVGADELAGRAMGNDRGTYAQE